MAPRPVKEKSAKVEDYRRFLEEAVSLKGKLAEATAAAGDGGFDESTIWGLYARTEKLVAVLKFKLGYETPGTFAKLPAAKEPRELLEDAARLLSASADEMSRGMLTEAVESLRKARNDLRAYLADKRRAKMRAGRQARRQIRPKTL